MSTFKFLQDYDPALDPTPEDEEYTPTDLTIIMLNELRGMQAADFNLWRTERLPAIEKLLAEGVEIGGELRLPAPEDPAEITEWDGGYSVAVSGGNCVQSQAIHETAQDWAGSGNRLLRQASTFMLRQWYLLPVEGFDGDDGFEQQYLENATCRPHAPMIRGRSGFVNKAVFARIESDTFTDRGGQERTVYRGFDPLPDHNQPITGTNMSDLVANIVGLFEERFSPYGPGFYGFLRTGAAQVFDMDRKPELRDETWRPATSVFQFNRAGEIEAAWDIAKQLG
jgi:hypothetical protein